MLSKLAFVSWRSLFGLLALLLAATIPLKVANADELVVADQRGLQKALLQAAGADQGLNYTLRWAEFDAAAPLLQALGAGAVDAGIAGDGPFLFAWGAGIPVKAAVLLPPRGGGHMTAIIVPPKSNIHTVEDLAGKRIATGRGSIGHLLALSLQRKGRLGSTPPKFVFLSPAQSKSALDSGAVDAWSTWEPYVTLADAQTGARTIADGYGVMPNNGFLVAADSAIENKHAQLADFFHRMTKAYAWGREHPEEFAALLSRQTGLPLDVARKVASKQITIPTAINDDILKQEQEVLATYRAAGIIHGDRALNEAFDRSFTP